MHQSFLSANGALYHLTAPQPCNRHFYCLSAEQFPHICLRKCSRKTCNTHFPSEETWARDENCFHFSGRACPCSCHQWSCRTGDYVHVTEWEGTEAQHGSHVDRLEYQRWAWELRSSVPPTSLRLPHVWGTVRSCWCDGDPSSLLRGLGCLCFSQVLSKFPVTE